MANYKRKTYQGDAQIRNAIKSLSGVIENVNNRVQDIATSIIEHAAGAGNGDMSRALDLCKTVARHRTLQVNYLIGYFKYFASTNINLRANDGEGKVSLMSKDSKGYRGFDVDGARANCWFEAFDDEGNRSTWYAGPAPADYQPLTIGDLAERMRRFSKNTAKLLDDTKTVNGKEVPAVQLNEADQTQVEHALAFIDRIANTLARHDEVAKLAAELKAKQNEAGEDEEVLQVLEVRERAVA